MQERMGLERFNSLLLAITLVYSFWPSMITCKSVGNQKNGQQRSYIDIDVTDPFKVPKASEYIDQQVPLYDDYGNRKNEKDNDHSINYKIGSVKVQADDRARVDEGKEHTDEEQYSSRKEYAPDQYGHHGYNDMQDDGPEVPADQEESPKDLEPEPYHSNYGDEDEHMPGDSRHNVPKGEWRHEEDPRSGEQRSHEEPGPHEDHGEPQRGADFERKGNDEPKYERGEDERQNNGDRRGREGEHDDSWERRGGESSDEHSEGDDRRGYMDEGPKEDNRERDYYDKDTRDRDD